MAAGGRAHDADTIRIEPARSGLAPDDPDCALDILPCGRMLRERSRGARNAILYGYDGHSLFVEIAPEGSDLEPVRNVIVISAAGPYNLNRLRLKDFRHVPLEIRLALLFLTVGHLALGPDRRLYMLASRLVARVAIHKFLFLSERA